MKVEIMAGKDLERLEIRANDFMKGRDVKDVKVTECYHNDLETTYVTYHIFYK